MRKKNWSNILSVLARTALAFVFVFGQTAWAMQGQNAKDKPTSDAVANAQQAPPNVSTASSKAQPAEEKTATSESSSAKEDSHHGGQHEGITVHGHWSIEVRNPDGSLVRHVEFENSLDPGFSTGGTTVPGGAAYLSAVLSGQWAGPIVPPAAGNWAILLVGPAGLSNVTVLTSPNAPCISALAACLIAQSGSSLCSTAAGISCNLSVTPQGTAPAYTSLQFSGSVAANQNGQISTVATLIGNLTCQPSTTTCLPTGVNTASFTSSTNFPGAPITVIAGQTVAVTVNISFS